MERCSYGQSYGEVFLATIVWRGVFMNYREAFLWSVIWRGVSIEYIVRKVVSMNCSVARCFYGVL